MNVWEALLVETESDLLRYRRRKLSPADVEDIRRRYATGRIKQSELADEYNITQPQVSKIVKRKQWKGKASA